MDMSDAIYQTEWHRYPPNVQRYLQLMIMRARRPFYLSAYGVMTMNLPNFVGVCTLNRPIGIFNIHLIRISVAQMDLLGIHVIVT